MPSDSFRIQLNEKWKLDDLYEFPHAFGQCYSFIYCFDSGLPPRDAERIDEALVGYPWRGGNSYVNIYFVLSAQVPSNDRPTIQSIRFNSPGWLDLALNAHVAIEVAKAVSALAGASATVAAAYAAIYKSLASIKITRERTRLQFIQLTRAQQRHILAMCADMAKFLGFKSLEDLHRRTGDPYVSLKLLLAHYRRLRTLAEFQQKGKAVLPKPENETDG